MDAFKANKKQVSGNLPLDLIIQGERTEIFNEIWLTYFQSSILTFSSEIVETLSCLEKEGPPFPSQAFDKAREEIFERIRKKPFSDFLKSIIAGVLYGYVWQSQ